MPNISNSLIDPHRVLYDVRDTMRLLNLGRSTLYSLIKDGKIKPLKVGRKTLIEGAEIERFVHALREFA